MPTLYTQPSVQTITSTAAGIAANTYTLTQVDDHSGNSAAVNNPNVLDIDLTLGNVRINLFAISNTLVEDGDSMGVGFTIKGTITANAGHNLVLGAYSEGGSPHADDETDTICGVSTATISGAAGTAFILTPAGRYNWILLVCDSGIS